MAVPKLLQPRLRPPLIGEPMYIGSCPRLVIEQCNTRRDIWSARQGVGDDDEILPTTDLVLHLERKYADARARLV